MPRAPARRQRTGQVPEQRRVQLKIRCFGGFEVWRDEEQLSRFESQKAKALFAYLLLYADRTLPRDHLAALLWPERSDEAARGATSAKRSTA